MRIEPSQSSVMNRQVGSTSGLTTVRSRSWTSAIARPVVDAGTAEGVGADADAGVADGVEVEDRRQVVDVGAAVVVRVGGVGGSGAGERDSLHAALSGAVAGGEEFVGPGGDPAGGVGVGRAAVGRVVLEAAVLGRVVRRRDDDAVGEGGGAAGAGRAVAVVAQDRVRDRGRRGVAVVGVDQHGHVVGREDLERGRPRRLGECVSVTAEEQRTVDPIAPIGTRRSPVWSRRCGPR